MRVYLSVGVCVCEYVCVFLSHSPSLSLFVHFLNPFAQVSFDRILIKDSSLPYYFPIAGFIPFSRIIVLCEAAFSSI